MLAAWVARVARKGTVVPTAAPGVEAVMASAAVAMDWVVGNHPAH